MTVAEIAEVLRLNQKTVRNWIDRGELPALHVGRRVRVKRADFDQLVARGYTGSPTGPALTIWDGEIPTPGIP
jgi:excisionase family DNA binding protein